MRQLINQADPKIQEDWKWGTAVWTLNGNVCAMASFKDKVKLNFFQGAKLTDAQKLFNSGLDAKNSRGIDFYQHNRVNTAELTNLIQAAIAYNSK